MQAYFELKSIDLVQSGGWINMMYLHAIISINV